MINSPVSPQYNAWDQFKNISVVIFDRPEIATSNAEFNAINAGIQDWNNINVPGCSNVTFGNTVRAGRPWDGEELPPDDTIYIVRTTDRFGQWKAIYNSISGQRAGLLYMHSDFNHQTSNLLYRIDNLAKHEAGHSFGIGNGGRSDPPSAYSQNSFVNGNLMITNCDIAAHKRVYCPVMPTPEPTAEGCYVPRTNSSEGEIFDNNSQMRPQRPEDCIPWGTWNEETCQCKANSPP